MLQQQHNISVIGAGACGLAACRGLLKNGFRVTLLEKESMPGGLIRSSVSPFSFKIRRLGDSLIDGLNDDIKACSQGSGNQFVFRSGVEISPSRLRELSQEYDGIIVAWGADCAPQRPHGLNVTSIPVIPCQYFLQYLNRLPEPNGDHLTGSSDVADHVDAKTTDKMTTIDQDIVKSTTPEGVAKTDDNPAEGGRTDPTPAGRSKDDDFVDNLSSTYFYSDEQEPPSNAQCSSKRRGLYPGYFKKQDIDVARILKNLKTKNVLIMGLGNVALDVMGLIMAEDYCAAADYMNPVQLATLSNLNVPRTYVVGRGAVFNAKWSPGTLRRNVTKLANPMILPEGSTSKSPRITEILKEFCIHRSGTHKAGEQTVGVSPKIACAPGDDETTVAPPMEDPQVGCSETDRNGSLQREVEVVENVTVIEEVSPGVVELKIGSDGTTRELDNIGLIIPCTGFGSVNEEFKKDYQSGGYACPVYVVGWAAEPVGGAGSNIGNVDSVIADLKKRLQSKDVVNKGPSVHDDEWSKTMKLVDRDREARALRKAQWGLGLAPAPNA